MSAVNVVTGIALLNDMLFTGLGTRLTASVIRLGVMEM